MHRLLLAMEMNPPPSNATRAATLYNSELHFDTNMVIELAALLCALICALGLNSIFRCARRCSHRFVLETPEQAATRQAATGLKKSHLRQIPVAVYDSGVDIPATECPICLGEFECGEKVRVLPNCNHAFHMRCIDIWLLSHSSCPNCRHSLLEFLHPKKKGGSAAANAAVDANEEATAETEASNSGNEPDQQNRVVVVIEQGS